MAVLQGIDAPKLLQTKIDSSIASSSNTIEVVYVDKEFSHLEYSIQEKLESSTSLSSPDCLQFDKPMLRPFGSCRMDSGDMHQSSYHPCGYVVELASIEAPLDILSFDTLSVTGKVTGTWTVAMADDYLAAMQENYPIGKINMKSPLSFSLGLIAPHIDLKRTRFLVFILDSPSGSIHLERLDFKRAETHLGTITRPAIWIWDNRPVIASPKSVVSDLLVRRVRRVYLQVGNDPESLLLFLRLAWAEGIEIYALDGSPDYLDSSAPLLERIRAVKEFNARHSDVPFAGFQIDIEPHTNPDFRVRLDTYGKLFISLFKNIRNIPGGPLRLSTVIPFWYDTLIVNNRTLAWHLIRNSDEAVIMSYRTNQSEIEAIARDELFYGEQMAKQISLGVETGRIPDESHIVFRRCSLASPEAIAVGSAYWCRATDYAVPGSRISFFGRDTSLRELLSSSLPYNSFAGWVIHSYETAPR